MRIGLEVHLQLPTHSKLFCSCPTSAEAPNSAICPTCLGYPGSRPVLNRRALELGVMIAKFFDCRMSDTIWFSRKTYFYPDLPKHFQITQYESPLGTDGHFDLEGKRVGIWRVHIEEDPGRIRRLGRSGEEVSFIDYNRSGVPLVEIVSAPDLESPSEARYFIDSLVTELRHLVGISANDEQVVRVDANISVGEERVEIKNIQGLRNLERALRYEANRQAKMLEASKPVVRETRRYDEERKVTMPAREKEFEEDYGYIGEPDLGEYDLRPLLQRMVLPETPLKRASRMALQYGIEEGTAKQMVLTHWRLADLFESLSAKVPKEKAIQWALGPISSNWPAFQRLMEEERSEEIAAIVMADAKGEINDNQARMQLLKLAGIESETTAKEEQSLEDLISHFLDDHPEVLRDYRSNPKSANTVIGHVMKESQGRYSSKEIVERVRRELEKKMKS